MKYSVELISCVGDKLEIIKVLREITGCDIFQAKNYIQSVPFVFMENLDWAAAEEIRDKLSKVGVEVNLIKESAQPYVPATSSMGSASDTVLSDGMSDYTNERNMLVNLWSQYDTYDKKIAQADNKIADNNRTIALTESSIKAINKEIEENKRIVATQGECIRPKPSKQSVLFNAILYFGVAGGITAAVVAGLWYIVNIFLVIVANDYINSIYALSPTPDGIIFFFGGPVLGLQAGIVVGAIGAIISVVKSICNNSSEKRRCKYYNVSEKYCQAKNYIDNLESVLSHIKEKECGIQTLKEKNKQLLLMKENLPKVVNSIPMKPELRSASGVALLISYMDEGRAYSIKEAVNVYTQDVKDALKLEELKKQTAYAQEQMLNSQIAAENTRIAAEYNRRTFEEVQRGADAMERAADSAAESAFYDRQRYWSNH